jgi:hypothetical protein
MLQANWTAILEAVLMQLFMNLHLVAMLQSGSCSQPQHQLAAAVVLGMLTPGVPGFTWFLAGPPSPGARGNCCQGRAV